MSDFKLVSLLNPLLVATTGLAGVSTNGNTDGTTGMVNAQIVFVGGNNITLSQSVAGQSATVSILGNAGGGGGGGGIGLAAGTQTATTNTVVFSNANGISFGMSGSTRVTASYTVPSTAGLISAINLSAGTTSGNLSNIVYADGNGVSFGLNGSTITASVAAAGGAQTGISGIVVSDATYTSGTVSFSNAGNITISSSVNGATQYIRLSGNPAQTTQSAIKAFGVSNTGQTAGNTGVSTGVDWVLAGSQSITLSQSTAVGGPNTVWIQHPGWITTAMLSNAATISNINISAGTTSNLLSKLTFADGNGVSFGLNGSTITASVAAAGGAQTGISGLIVSDTTYTSGTVSFSNAGNITISSSVNGATQYIRLSGNAAQTTQSAIKGFGVSNTGNTAGNTGVSTGIDWVIGASGGVTASQSTVGGGPNTVWISVANPVAQTNQTVGLYGLGNTTQNSSTTLDARTVSFNGLGQMTVGFSNGSVQLSVTAPPIGTAVKAVASAGSTGTITRFAPEDHQHAGVAAFAVTNTGNTAGNTRSQVGTIFIAASGGITASQSTGAAGNDTVWLSVATPVAQTTQSAIKAFGASNTGNTAGNTGVSTGIDWVIAGTNNITVSQSTVGGGPNTIWVSGAAGGGGNTLTFFAASNTTQSSSGTVNVSSIVFAGAGIASVGVTNGSVVVSVPSGGGAGDGGVFAGVSTGGNTAGSTGTVSTGNFVLVGSNNITLSQSTGAAGSAATVSIIGPSTSQLTFVPPISLSSNGATISIMLASTLTLSYWEPVPWISTTLTQPAQNTAYFNKWNVDDAVDCGVLAIPVVMTAGWTSTTAVVTNSTAATSSSTSFSAGNTYSYGLWSMGTGGYSTNLYTYFTNSCSFSTKIQWSQSNSNSTTGTQSYGYSVAFTYGGPTLTTGTITSQNAGSTVTTWATTTFSSSGSSTASSNGNTTSVWPGGTTNASWAGSRIMYLPFSTSITPGLQWFGLVRSSTTTGAAVAGSHSLVNVTWSTYDSGLRWAPFGLRTADFAGLFYHPAFQIEGYRTNGSSFNWTSNYVASGSSVGAIALSQIGPNAATDFNATATFSRFYVKLMNNMFL